MGSTTADDDSITVSDAGDTITENEMETDGDVESQSPPPQPDTSPFLVGEKVFALHGHCLYTAKVQKAEFGTNGWKYFLHYFGWNKSWDEWLGLDLLKKHTEENIKEQQALVKMYGRGKMTRVSQTKPKNPAAARSKKRKTEVKKGSTPLEKQVNVQMPSTLKRQLVDDCEFINHLDKLVKLPRSPNVDGILSKYLDYRSNEDGMIVESVDEILRGIRCYFDRALPAMLLYKSERQQYQEAIEDTGSSPSTVYGAEHLLRLFVKFPEILSHANIEDQTLKDLEQELHGFLKFLQKNQSAFFLSTYQTPEGFDVSTEK